MLQLAPMDIVRPMSTPGSLMQMQGFTGPMLRHSYVGVQLPHQFHGMPMKDFNGNIMSPVMPTSALPRSGRCASRYSYPDDDDYILYIHVSF